MYQIASSLNFPWMIGGYFNVILSDEKKLGGAPVTLNETEDFAFCVTSCELFDMGFKGSPYTWWNDRAVEDCIFKRLDRIMRLKNLERALSKWSIETYGDIFKQLSIREEVAKVKEQLFEEDPSIINRIVLQKAQAELTKYLNIEEQYWKQKAGKNCNRIVWLDSVEQISEEAVKFFSNQFKQEGDTEDFVILQHVPAMVSHEQNVALCSYLTKKVVKGEVFASMGDSASGPDGFTGLFYQQCWDIVGNDVHAVVLAFFDGKELPKSITHTNLVLIPKKQSVQTFSDMRPISLSNFINKVISKVLHDRESIIPSFISSNQSGRLIENNWYSMLLNGQATGFFHSSGGVKQGDPLSPTLFLLSSEVLSRALNGLFDNDKYIGYGMPKWTSPLNHLAYVDDTIIFVSADPYSLGRIMQILKRKKKIYYADIFKKLKGKLHSWKGKLLSFGGKVVLINSLLQSMPSHLFLVIAPPKCVIKKLHRIFSRFFGVTRKKEGVDTGLLGRMYVFLHLKVD
ncbi:uncharacterized protein LOC132631262 [Lycium barbarum]|uniref:uncharacterized protein LOC132631262 n=1 Tax=Lycium barbarum TaxID=112863 RepID=UPI00293ED42E|nr:uncharacterized protein LOC132631262 [Lycium barbarum]